MRFSFIFFLTESTLQDPPRLLSLHRERAIHFRGVGDQPYFLQTKPKQQNRKKAERDSFPNKERLKQPRTPPSITTLPFLYILLSLSFIIATTTAAPATKSYPSNEQSIDRRIICFNAPLLYG